MKHIKMNLSQVISVLGMYKSIWNGNLTPTLIYWKVEKYQELKGNYYSTTL